MFEFGFGFFLLLVAGGEAGSDALTCVPTTFGDGVDGRVVVAGYECC